jgi:hypothetical protein
VTYSLLAEPHRTSSISDVCIVCRSYVRLKYAYVRRTRDVCIVCRSCVRLRYAYVCVCGSLSAFERAFTTAVI